VEVRREERDGRCRVRFDAASIPAGKVLETDLPPDVSPYITVDFSTGESWNGVARGFTAIALPSAGGGALKDYVAAAVGRENAASGPGERKALIQRILLRIQQDVRFASASPAENAIVPRPPLETLRRGCGDCKDLAALLVACLSEAGIEARLALLMSGNGTDVPACLPGFGLFSHVIAYVPEYDTWIDPTATFYRPGDLPPGDQGRSALVISPDTASLAVTPESAPEDNLLRQVTELRLSERGHADVEETRTASGSIEASYRKQFDGQDPADRRRQVEQLSRNAYQTTDVAGIEIADPRDLERRFSVWFSARGARTGFTDGTRTTVEIKPGSLLEFLPSCITRAQQAGEALCRAQDLYLSLPFVYEHEYRIHPAPGFHAAPLPEDQVLHIGPAVFSSHLTSLADGTVLARIRFDTVKRRFTPAEADALRAGALRLLQAPPIRVTFGRAGESLTAGE
jgi:hypothetical protein